MLLQIDGLSKFFRGLHAVEDVSMSVERGQIVGLIGPNGAGKSTIFNLITGVLKPTSGRITFDGTDITGRPPHVAAKRGIGRTFQLTPLFADFTTLENVVASNYLHPRSHFWGTLLGTPRSRSNERSAVSASAEILTTVGLWGVKDEFARNLSHGHQKMLGIARALSVKPQLLLLDEPLGGLNSDETVFTMEIMQKLRQQGVTVLVIEHNMNILDICDRVVAISFGRKIAEGSVIEVRNHADVINAYLGSAEAGDAS